MRLQLSDLTSSLKALLSALKRSHTSQLSHVVRGVDVLRLNYDDQPAFLCWVGIGWSTTQRHAQTAGREQSSAGCRALGEEWRR